MAKKNKNNQVASTAVSSFDGRLLNYIGTGLLQLLVIALMGGIGAAVLFALGTDNVIGIVVLAVCAFIGLCWAGIIFIKWETKHTVISGYRLKFKSSALNLFFNILKWILLTVITVGIYALWLPIKTRKWRVKHTTATPDESEYGYAQPQVTFYTYPQN